MARPGDSAEQQGLCYVVGGVPVPVSVWWSLDLLDQAMLRRHPLNPERRERDKRNLSRGRVWFAAFGAVLGLGLASFPLWIPYLSGDKPVPDRYWPLVMVSFVVLPFAGAWLSWWASPLSSLLLTQKRFNERMREAENAKVQAQEQEAESAQKAATETRWLTAVRDAMYWWVAHGKKLNSDPDYLEEYVAIHSAELTLKQSWILETFRSSDEPFSTKQGAREVAEWFLATHPEAAEEHSSDPDFRRADRLADICRAYHRREAALLPEVEAYLHAKAAKLFPKRQIDPLKKFEEIIGASDSHLEQRRVGTEMILERAKDLPPSEREDYVRDHLRLLLRLIAADMERRMQQ